MPKPFSRLHLAGSNRGSKNVPALLEMTKMDGNPGPDFLCVGAQKAGTGWLYEQLRSHPDFWMPPLKELHYFDRQWRSPRALQKSETRIGEARVAANDERDRNFLDAMHGLAGQPEIDWNGYANLFAPKTDRISGDITPGYSTLEPDIIHEVVAHFSNARVIFLARDPVERAWSHLSMWIRHGTIERFEAGDLESITRHLLRPEVQRRSYPSQIVARWREQVRPELFRVFFFDDLKRDPVATRAEIIRFLGGDPGKPSGGLSASHNPKARLEKLELGEQTRKHLAQFFAEELRACARELGGPAREWPARYDLSL